jgi:hypothetical protein
MKAALLDLFIGEVPSGTALIRGGIAGEIRAAGPRPSSNSF